jgi:hypothetical protein
VRDDHKKITDYFNHFLAHDEIVANFPEVTEESVIRMGKRSSSSNLLPLIRGVAVVLYYLYALLPLCFTTSKKRHPHGPKVLQHRRP